MRGDRYLSLLAVLGLSGAAMTAADVAGLVDVPGLFGSSEARTDTNDVEMVKAKVDRGAAQSVDRNGDIDEAVDEYVANEHSLESRDCDVDQTYYGHGLKNRKSFHEPVNGFDRDGLAALAQSYRAAFSELTFAGLREVFDGDGMVWMNKTPSYGDIVNALDVYDRLFVVDELVFAVDESDFYGTASADGMLETLYVRDPAAEGLEFFIAERYSTKAAEYDHRGLLTLRGEYRGNDEAGVVSEYVIVRDEETGKDVEKKRRAVPVRLVPEEKTVYGLD